MIRPTSEDPQARPTPVQTRLRAFVGSRVLTEVRDVLEGQCQPSETACALDRQHEESGGNSERPVMAPGAQQEELVVAVRALTRAIRALTDAVRGDLPATNRVGLTVTQAATMLGCGRTRIFELLKNGELRRCPRVGRHVLVSAKSVEKLLSRPSGTRVRGRSRWNLSTHLLARDSPRFTWYEPPNERQRTTREAPEVGHGHRGRARDGVR